MLLLFCSTVCFVVDLLVVWLIENLFGLIFLVGYVLVWFGDVLGAVGPSIVCVDLVLDDWLCHWLIDCLFD